MHSRLPPSPQPRAHLTVRPSPPKPHFITLCTDRHSTQLSPREQDTHRPTLALSPNRHSPKIKLVSPLKKNNGSHPTTKENIPTRHGIHRMDQDSSPEKRKYIELGGNTKPLPRNFNEISNISISNHLDNQKRRSPDRHIPNKYSAFVIMGHKKAPQTARPQHHITFNNKPFDISSLQSQIIHVAPFRHIRTQTAPSPPAIREETEHSSLRDSYQEELRNIQQMRRELEVESSCVREALAASKIEHQACTSQLVQSNESERSQRRSPSKLFNFQDVPLQQSRLTTEEKIYHPSDNCHEPRQSQDNVKVVQGQVTDTHQLHHQPVEAYPEVVCLPPVEITTAKTLINQLNFITNSKLVSNLRGEVCVQTEQGPCTARSKLAIVRNEECLIKLGASLQNCEAPVEVHQQSIMEEPQDQVLGEGNEVQQKQQSIIQQKSAIQDELQSSQLLAIPKEEHNKDAISNHDVIFKEQQVKQHETATIHKQFHRSNPSICSQTIFIPQIQIPIVSQMQVRAESNISIQLQPVALQQQVPDNAQSAISDRIETNQFTKIVSQKLPQKEQSEKPAILSLQSARTTLGKQSWPKRVAASKRSINNSIYL